MEDPIISQAKDKVQGFFYCGHCNHVAELPQEEFREVTETFKCPRCKKWAVRWRFVSQVARRAMVPVPPERGRELFQQMREVVDSL